MKKIGAIFICLCMLLPALPGYGAGVQTQVKASGAASFGAAAAQPALNPFDRFAGIQELELRGHISYKYDQESSDYEDTGDWMAPFVMTGPNGCSSKLSSRCDSEWRGVLKLVPGGGRGAFYYKGTLSGNVSGVETEEVIFECNVAFYEKDQTSTAKSRSVDLTETTASGRYPGEAEATLVITPEGYILGFPGNDANMNMPGKLRRTYRSQGSDSGTHGASFPNYEGNNDNYEYEGESSVSICGYSSYALRGPLPDQGLTLTGEETFTVEINNPVGVDYDIYHTSTSYTYSWTLTGRGR